MTLLRTRWAAVGAAVAITLGAGGIGFVAATSPSGATTFVSIAPCRLIDTRPDFNVGAKSSPLGPDEVHTVAAHGSNGECEGIPADATAISMNMTAVDASEPTFLTVWAADESRPNASSLNPVPGAPPTPNALVTELDSGGRFNVYNLGGNVHVLADVNGYYVDHHHDDRYYPRTEVDTALDAKADAANTFTKAEVTALAEGAEAIAGEGVNIPTELEPQSTFHREIITTSVDGQLLVSRFGIVTIDCTSARLYYNVVDGVPMRSSVVYVADGTPLNRILIGTTEDRLPAGAHEISLGAQCFTGSSSGSGSTVISSVSVVVIP